MVSHSHRLCFCEPATCLDTYYQENTIEVLEDFYQVLKDQKPELLISSDGDNNAYLFGSKFPLEEYHFEMSHGNDVAQTGLVEVTDLTLEEAQEIMEHSEWEDFHPNVAEGNIDISVYRKDISPRILFVGETYGGDVGANLYVHRDKEGKIDGLIVDVHYLFEEERKEE